MKADERVYGHRKMRVWQNLDKVEALVRGDILRSIPRSNFQLRDQIDRSCSSAVANFIEGYYSGSIKEYLGFLHYSKRSLAELQDWVRRSYYNCFTKEEVYLLFDDLAIKTLYLINRLIFSLQTKCLNPSKPSKP